MDLVSMHSDVIKKLLLKLNPEQIVYFCRTNKSLNDICQDDSLWQELVEKYFFHTILPGLETWRQTFNALVKTREIEVIIDDYPKVFYAGTIIISNITTIEDFKKLLKIVDTDPTLLKKKKISIPAFLHDISSPITNPIKYSTEISIGRGEYIYGGFIPENLEEFPDKSILIDIRSTDLPDVKHTSLSLFEGMDEIRCFVAKYI